MRSRFAVLCAMGAVALAGCGGDDDEEAVGADELPDCLRDAGLTVVTNGADLRRLEGFGETFPAVGTAGFNAGSIYSEEGDWEVLIVRKAGPADESESAVEGPPLDELAERFDELPAVAYVQPRDEAVIDRAFDRCVD